ncbi:MAG: DUF5069 domain-containing protein [Opitutaceae bacterium]|nr:DUF5069 domain-containing protein [Opitutaceae bacterium]
MSSHVPMIPCNVSGPLGVLHLPRLWLKVSLEARGKLAAGYPGLGKGYDMMVVTALGLNPDAVKKFVAEKRPTYQQFEAWIKAQPGVKLDRNNIHRLNTAILNYHHAEDLSKEIRAATGYKEDGSVTSSACELNALDDWQAFHAAELK